MKHIIKSQQFNQEYLETLFKVADSLEKDCGTPMTGKIMASLFYEPSTRTRFSFESAMLRLGGQVITTENAKEFSSVSKGETLEDSIRIISNYADVIVLRHSEEGSAKRAASVSHVPVINAGDGPGQHPTQALLDLYTIKRELGKIKGVKIAMVGDLKYGRTIRSLVYLLGKYENIKIFLVSPEGLRIGNDIKEYLHKHEVSYEEVTDLDRVISKVDVVYQTRIQKERFPSLEEYEKHKGCYRIDNSTIKKMKEGSIIMHPLPRVDEISTEIDDSPKAIYFKQAYYGLLIRMALLKMVVR